MPIHSPDYRMNRLQSMEYVLETSREIVTKIREEYESLKRLLEDSNKDPLYTAIALAVSTYQYAQKEIDNYKTTTKIHAYHNKDILQILEIIAQNILDEVKIIHKEIFEDLDEQLVQTNSRTIDLSYEALDYFFTEYFLTVEKSLELQGIYSNDYRLLVKELSINLAQFISHIERDEDKWLALLSSINNFEDSFKTDVLEIIDPDSELRKSAEINFKSYFEQFSNMISSPTDDLIIITMIIIAITLCLTIIGDDQNFIVDFLKYSGITSLTSISLYFSSSVAFSLYKKFDLNRKKEQSLLAYITLLGEINMHLSKGRIIKPRPHKIKRREIDLYDGDDGIDISPSQNEPKISRKNLES